MPTIFIINGFRFYFFSNEGNEPVHVHVEKGDYTAKFWLEPIELVYSYGFNSKEISRIRNVVVENSETIKIKWNEHFNKS
jgi:uncharacterized protein YegJ (DUF2314 family)